MQDLPPFVGRYEILALAGKGAMGVVYKARDPVMCRTVAIKIVSYPATLAPRERAEFRDRFVREAQFAGNLHHPNIVTIYDIGEEDGVPFMALEFLEGESLTRRLARCGPVPVDEALGIVRQVAQGLAYAHERGVVHRDVKPDNILLDGEGRAVITDFGIARLSSSDLTRTGEVLGTPHFMSPEQVQGKKVDGRSDLFSLGVVLFALVTGRRPFVGDSMTEVCTAIVQAPPQPYPGAVAVPDTIVALIDKLLEKDPARRFADARELIAALDVVIEQRRPPAPAPVPALEPVFAGARGRPAAAAGAAAAPAAATAGAAAATAARSLGTVAMPALPLPQAAPVPARKPAPERAAASKPAHAPAAGPASRAAPRATSPAASRPEPRASRVPLLAGVLGTLLLLAALLALLLPR